MARIYHVTPTEREKMKMHEYAAMVEDYKRLQQEQQRGD